MVVVDFLSEAVWYMWFTTIVNTVLIFFIAVIIIIAILPKDFLKVLFRKKKKVKA